MTGVLTHPTNAPVTRTAPSVAIARGDGIGPEIMDAALRIMEAAGAQFVLREVALGESVYRQGHSAGIAPDSWDVLRSAQAIFKAPITTPSGGGFKSLNVTLRKTLGLYANIRPCQSLAPVVPGAHPGMDLVIVRENEEDLYAGIEHRQTRDVVQCLKLITRPGCEKISRYAFDYARQTGRRKVTCMTKDNIMKLTDGLFRRVFEEVAAEYPEIEIDHKIIDICAALIATDPNRFDVVLAPNLYGDILSDIAAQVTGSVGLAGSANIGTHGAMFEAIHGSAPDIAGQDIANPSGLLMAGCMMLAHLGQGAVATRIHKAWALTLEAGLLTADLAGPDAARKPLGTQAFADAVIERLSDASAPRHLTIPAYGGDSAPVAAPQAKAAMPVVVQAAATAAPAPQRSLDGVDVFLCADLNGETPADGAARLARIDAMAETILQLVAPLGWTLGLVTNRGVKVWPQGLPETDCTDHWRCRFRPLVPGGANRSMIWGLLKVLGEAGFDPIKTENLYSFDGVRGYSQGQGE